MDQVRLKKISALTMIFYLAVVTAFYPICGDQLRYRREQSDMLAAGGVIGEITADTVVEQKLTTTGNTITGITLSGATYARANSGSLLVELYADDSLLEGHAVDISSLQDNADFFVQFHAQLPKKARITLRITAPDSAPNNAVTLYYGNMIQSGRGQVNSFLGEDDFVRVNGEALNGALCVRLDTSETLWFGKYYWYFAAVLLILLCVVFGILLKKNRAGRSSQILNIFVAFDKYWYLIKQLVIRDFKAKYKRSVLGVLWSFLNPLLTMTVQYIVFSTLFHSEIPNFALYLVIGIVCFSFFSEATSMTLTSIVGNASLITKVYVPKYIYPLTRVMSSTVNFLLALIPLMVVMVVTHTPIRVSVLLLPLAIVCLFSICLGIGMLLASSMVFFRDTQFLWNVLSMLWMYATPIFYPESILPVQLLPLFKCNPLYHITRFIRMILISGVSPEPKAYGLMIIASIVPLALGAWVFKRTQDRFVLHI